MDRLSEKDMEALVERFPGTGLHGLGYNAQSGRAQAFGPQAKGDALNGQRNWITQAFSRHLATIGKDVPKLKRGFHSLRKTFIAPMKQ